MPFKIHCPGCNRALDVPDRALGKTLPCPICKQPIAVPRSQPSEAGVHSGPSSPGSPEPAVPATSAKPMTTAREQARPHPTTPQLPSIRSGAFSGSDAPLGQSFVQQLGSRMGLAAFQLSDAERVIEELEVSQWIFFWTVRSETAKLTVTSQRLLYQATVNIFPPIILWFSLYIVFAIATGAATLATGGSSFNPLSSPVTLFFSGIASLFFFVGIVTLWMNLRANRRLSIPLEQIDSVGLSLRPTWKIPLAIFVLGGMASMVLTALLSEAAWLVFVTVPLDILYVAGIGLSLIWFRLPYLDIRTHGLTVRTPVTRQNLNEALAAGEQRVSRFVQTLNTAIGQTSIHRRDYEATSGVRS